MRCQPQLTFLAQIVRDHAADLPPAAKAALEEKAQGAINAIEHDLSQPLLPPPVETPET